MEANPSLAVVLLVLSLFVVVAFLIIRERAGQREEQGNSPAGSQANTVKC